MKTIVQYVRDYLREEWNPVLFGVTGLFLTVAIVLNYVLGAETTIVRSLRHPGWQFIFYLAFYALPFMVTLVAWSATQQDYSVFKRRQFWLLSLFTFSILSAYVVLHILPWYLYTHLVWIYDSVREDHRIIALRCAGNLLLVLGVIAHRTKSIYGGIILHLGVAYLMELAGSLRMAFR